MKYKNEIFVKMYWKNYKSAGGNICEVLVFAVESSKSKHLQVKSLKL